MAIFFARTRASNLDPDFRDAEAAQASREAHLTRHLFPL